MTNRNRLAAGAVQGRLEGEFHVSSVVERETRREREWSKRHGCQLQVGFESA